MQGPRDADYYTDDEGTVHSMDQYERETEEAEEEGEEEEEDDNEEEEICH